MDKKFLFNFKTTLSGLEVPIKLNNPFNSTVPEIAKIAATEFQDYIISESVNQNYDFQTQRSKMFGVLVVQKKDGGYCYLGSVSGKLSDNIVFEKLIPSVFDESVGDFFIDKGMKELGKITIKIKRSENDVDVLSLKKERKQKSIGLQKRLFENYHFLNISGEQKNILEIFKQSSHGFPPAASGECAAPKLLQYAIKNQLKPVALTEFWWGSSMENKDREHKAYYPSCKNRCRPVLEYILEDVELFINREETTEK